MEVRFDTIEDGMVQYRLTDSDGKEYGVADTIQEGMIVDTLVIDMETYDEVEDSELFKKIITARALYSAESYEVHEAMKKLY